jgi:hypothetical protein
MVRQREPSASRRSLGREQSLRILVVCGGVATEPTYLDGLKRHVRNRTVSIRIRAKGVAPLQLIEEGIRLRDRDPWAFDRVWCVTDVDDFDLGNAIRLAAAERIDLAVSNPCFELWLLLHHQDCRAHLAGYPAVLAKLRKHVASYDKSRLDFGDFSTGVTDAIGRGRELDPKGDQHGQNPSTSVWRLAHVIMGGDDGTG